MAYRVYLLDTINYVELDTEDIDLTTVFSVADIKDLGVRKDSITKQVNFKGTKVNNNAFGSLFHLNKTADTGLANKLFFNYNPLRTVDCIVMEDAMLVFKGNIRVLEINVSKEGWVTYQTVITGKFIEFKTTIQDKLLSDLDFTDLKHRYHTDVIFGSWDSFTERTDENGTRYNKPFEYGSGYLYPFADYGVQFKQNGNTVNAYNTDFTKFHVTNFRAGVYAKEYLDRIFKQTSFTYEIKGDPTFLERINALVIPNADERMAYKFSGFNTVVKKSIVTVETNTGMAYSKFAGTKLLTLNHFTNPPQSVISPYIKQYGGFPNVLQMDRTVKSDALAEIVIDSITNGEAYPVTVLISVGERDEVNNNNTTGWTSLAESKFKLLPGQTVTNKTVTLAIAEREFAERKQLSIGLGIVGSGGSLFDTSGPNSVTFTVGSTEFSMPKDTTTQFTADIRINSGMVADIVAPTPPENIKQIDFIKFLMTLFNLYAYPSVENDKHIVFERYDDYYALAAPQYIVNNSLNWTSKIDYNSGLKVKSNVTLPKSYQFSYKDDNDYLNSEYKKKYGVPYGTYQFNDKYGVVDTKKVEVGFSPSPLMQYNNTERIHPIFYQNEYSSRKPAKTNIRILYYNGVKDCSSYIIAKDTYNNSTWSNENIATKTNYPQLTTFYYDGSTAIEDLNFGRPREIWFIKDAGSVVEYAYGQHYRFQVSELTNPNLVLVECDALLNEFDIANLDLKVPVYIDLGEFGHSYFKVLSVEYAKNNTPSRVTLQKIVLGTDR